MKIPNPITLLSLLALGAFLAFPLTLKAELSAEDKKAVETQTKDYPLPTCLISGEKLGGDMGAPIDYLEKGKDGKASPRLVRFCCKSCIKTFQKDSEKYLKMIDEAKSKKTAASR
jgi:transposase-like protein